MSRRKSSIVAWMLCGVVVTSMVVQSAIALVQPGAGSNAFALLENLLQALLVGLFAVVSALIVSRQPHNMIGWLLMCPAIAGAIPADTYISTFAAAPVPAPTILLLALWFGSWNWLLLIFPTLFILLLFPTGSPPSTRWRWIIVLGLGMWALLLFYATFAAELGPISGELEGAWTVHNPIGFLPESAFPYQVWTALLGLFTVACAASVFVRFRRAATVERAQMKWLLYACAAFAAVYLPLLMLTGEEGLTTLDIALGLLFLVSLMAIPMAIAVAILRYHLWDIDVLIRRTLVYVPLTAILAGVFAASIKLSQSLFAPQPGGQSEATTVLTTLIIVAAFDPVKARLQRFVDARFKDGSDPQARWKEYGEQLKGFLQMNDDSACVKRLLEEAVMVFEAKGGAAYFQRAGKMERIHAIGHWADVPDMSVPLEHRGSTLGRLTLGVRRDGRPFDDHDRKILADYATSVAAVISLGRGNPA